MRRFVIGLAVMYFAALAPSLGLADDQLIAKQIAQKLAEHKKAGELRGFEIDLQVDHGTVVLKGHVATVEQKERVMCVAQQTPGVTKVMCYLGVGQKAPRSNLWGSLSNAPGRLLGTPAATEQQATAAAAVDKATAAVDAEAELSSRRRTTRSASPRLTLDAAPRVTDPDAELAPEVAVHVDLEEPATDEPIAMQNTTVKHLLAQDSPASTSTESEVVVANREATLESAATELETVSASEQMNPQPVSQQQIVSQSLTSKPIAQQVVKLQEPQPLAPQTMPKSAAADAQIAQIAVQRLERAKQKGHLVDFSLDVEVNDGVIHLDGHASTEEQKQLIQEIVRRVPNVTQVVSGIQVTELEAAPAPLVHSMGHQQAATGSGVAGNQRAQNQAISLTSAAAAGGAAPMLAQQPVGYGGAGPGAAQQQMAAAQGGPNQFMQLPYNRSQTPVAFAPASTASAAEMGPRMHGGGMAPMGSPVPATYPPVGLNPTPARYDHPSMPAYAWPSYASHPNFAAVTYPKQYSPSAWPYIGPFYPYPQVPLGWRKVTLEWDDGWWMLDFKDK